MSKSPSKTCDIEPVEFASPPCYAHEVDPSYMGLDVKTSQECKKTKQGKNNCKTVNSEKSQRLGIFQS